MKRIIKLIILLFAVKLLIFGILAAGPGWMINPASYNYNGNITSGVFDVGGQIGGEEDSVAAFCEGECRGVVGGLTYPPQNEVVFMLTVYSNHSIGDTLYFKYWDANENLVYDISDDANIEFSPDMLEGTLDPYAPYELPLEEGSLPASVVNLIIEINNGDVILSWDEVETTVFGNPLTVDGYNIYTSNSPHTEFEFFVSTIDTTYIHEDVAITGDKLFYKVAAYVEDK